MKQERKKFFGCMSAQKMLVMLTTVIMLALFAFPAGRTALAETGECMYPADIPLEVRGQAAPGIVNLLWDASGSMLWTTFTDDGFFFTSDGYAYGYVFPESKYYYDSYTEPEDGHGRAIPESKRHYWESQYAGYNYMYYDPDVNYEPWARWTQLQLKSSYVVKGDGGDANPGYLEIAGYDTYKDTANNVFVSHFGGDANADINTPRQHPTQPTSTSPYTYDTFNLNAPFYNFKVGTEAGGVVIDDDAVTTHTDGAIVVDDTDPGFSASDGLVNWMRYNNDMYVKGNIHYRHLSVARTAEWRVDIAQPGVYKVEVSISGYYAWTENAVYTVFDHNDNVLHRETISQRYDPLQQFWASLGTHEFGNAARITLEAPVESGKYVAVDAVRLVPLNDIVVDDTDPGFSASDGLVNWMRYNNDMYVKGNIHYRHLSVARTAEWRVDVEYPGVYEVEVSISGYYAWTENAVYTVFDHNDNVLHTETISQRYDPLQQFWASLGTHTFSNAARITVEAPAESGKYVAVDAVRLVLQRPDTPTPFSRTGPWMTAVHSSAYPEHASPNYLYTDSGGTHFTATWTANNLDSTKTYDVYTRWVASGNRSTGVEYRVDHAGGSETVSVNQQANGGTWNLLAQDVSFGAAGTGTVTLSHTPAYSDSDRACADAVMFIESGLYSDGRVIFAHYFTQNEEGDVFLVDLNNRISYFKADLGSDERTVDRLLPLTAAEAAAAGIVTGRTYLEERQNFANWYQFYRRRYFTGIAAAGQFLDGWSNIFLRIQSFPEEYEKHYNLKLPLKFNVAALDMTIRDEAGNEDYYNEKDEALFALYTMPHPWGGTPMRQALYDSGFNLFEDGKGWSDLGGQSPYRKPIERSGTHLFPYFKPEFGGDCQQAFAVMMTDGMWTGTLKDTVGNIDTIEGVQEISKKKYLGFGGGVFGDSYSDTLADVAMYFYNRDLQPQASETDATGLANLVPADDIEDPKATHQRQILYGISFGAPGVYTDEQRQRFSESLKYGIEPTDSDWKGWPEPKSGEASTIDDLWHATINARGAFLSAGNPQKLIEALEKVKEDIERRLGTAAAVATSTVRQQVGTQIFQAQYNSNRWSGELLAMSLDNVISWRARDVLEAMPLEERVIITHNGSQGIPFRYASLTADQQAMVKNDPDIIAYLRGDRYQEVQYGGNFRNRDYRLGDIVHSQPNHHRGIVYVGANDGMLHGFDANTGQEIFAYVPNLVFKNLERLTRTEFRYQYFVDGPPVVRNVADGKTVLVGGLSGGGKGYYALDVTDAKNVTEAGAKAFALWEYSADGDDDLGYSFSRPAIMKTEAEGWVTVFGNGYNSVNEEAVLYVLRIADGAVIKKFHTKVADCNGFVGGVSPVDVELDGYIDFAYAGDLKGNLWKFDFRGESKEDWKIAYNSKPLFTARNKSGQVQPVTTAPDVMMACYYPGYLVVFGTGKFDGDLDFGDTRTQSLYGIWDWQEAWDYSTVEGDGDDMHLGYLRPDRTLSSLAGNWDLPENIRALKLLEQTVGTEIIIGEDGERYLFLSDNVINYWNPYTNQGEHVGWCLDLPGTGERIVNNPRIRSGIVWVLASIPSLSPCVAGGSAALYALNACTGGKEPQFEGGDVLLLDDLPPDITFLPPHLLLIPDPGGDPPDQLEIPPVRSRGLIYWHEWPNW